MTADGDKTLHEASLPVAQSRQSLPQVASRTDEYVATALQLSAAKLADLDKQIRTAQRREVVLWWFFVLAFALTLAAGSAGVVLIFLAGLKVGIASGAVGLLPGCTSAWLRGESASQIKNRQAIETKRDAEIRLREADEAIAQLPSGPQKEKLQVERVRKILSRMPK